MRQHWSSESSWSPALVMGWIPGLAPQIRATVWPIGADARCRSTVEDPLARRPGLGAWRFGGAGTVALGSAVISYGHLRSVLVAWHYSGLAAAVGPLVLDGLMVVCGFALLANSHAAPDDSYHQ